MMNREYLLFFILFAIFSVKVFSENQNYFEEKNQVLCKNVTMKFNIFNAVLSKNEENIMKDIKTAMENFVIKSKNETINNNKINYCLKNGYYDFLKKSWPSGLINYDINFDGLSQFPAVNKYFNDIKINVTKCFHSEFIHVGRHINQIYNTIELMASESQTFPSKSLNDLDNNNNNYHQETLKNLTNVINQSKKMATTCWTGIKESFINILNCLDKQLDNK